MKCPKCGISSTVVKDSRNLADTRRRRRECTECGNRFTTTEVEGIHRAESLSLVHPEVIKRDKESESFDDDKLRASIERACSRRGIPREDLEQLLELIREKAYKSEGLRVDVYKIIEWSVSGLGELDKISAIRYAAQYLDFNTPEEFSDYCAKLCE